MKLITKTLLATLAISLFASVTLPSKSVPAVKNIILTSDNTLILNDAIMGSSVSDIIQKLKILDKPTIVGKFLKPDPIYLILQTPGGDVSAGLEMIEALKGLNRPVHTITMFAASMGFQTVQQLGTRYIFKSGTLMSHRARGEFSGEFGGVKPSQTSSRIGFWEQKIKEMDEKTVERTNGKQTLKSYTEAYRPELWLTGTQAVEQGYADEIITVKCDSTLNGATTKDASEMNPFMSNMVYDISNCPLNTNPINVRPKISTTKGPMFVSEFVKAGGGFGTACLVASGLDPKKICALDTSLTLESVYQSVSKFKEYYMDIRSRVIQMKF